MALVALTAEQKRGQPAVLTVSQARQLRKLWAPPASAAPAEVTEVDIGPLRGALFSPPNPVGAALYVQGGGVAMGSIDSYQRLISDLAVASPARILAVNRRQVPEYSFPAPLEDTLAAWRYLCEQYPAVRKVMLADSSGGALALAAMVEARDKGLAMPDAAYLISPKLDYSRKKSSQRATSRDPDEALLSSVNGLYFGDASPGDPRVSPILADLSGLPPILVHAGEDDPMAVEAHALSVAVLGAGGRIGVKIWPRMIHIFPYFAHVLSDGIAAIEEAGAWLRCVLQGLPCPFPPGAGEVSEPPLRTRLPELQALIDERRAARRRR